MDSDNDSYHSENEFYYPHEITYFLNVKRTRTPDLKWLQWKFNTKTAYKVLYGRKIINTLFAGLGRSVLGKTVPSVLSTRALGLRRTQDLWHSFSQYGPPGRQMTYMYCSLHKWQRRDWPVYQTLKRERYENEKQEHQNCNVRGRGCPISLHSTQYKQFLIL